MGNAQGDGLSHLATKTIHYNPSNLNARENAVTVTEFSFFFNKYGSGMDNTYTLPEKFR